MYHWSTICRGQTWIKPAACKKEGTTCESNNALHIVALVTSPSSMEFSRKEVEGSNKGITSPITVAIEAINEAMVFKIRWRECGAEVG